MQEITVGPVTKPAHQKFIAWLNGLLNSYQTGFWDWSIANMIKLAFIDTHYTSIQELYADDGFTPTGFIVFGALNTSSPQILVFSEEGEPIMYNDDNANDLFLFNSLGRLTEFFEGVSVPLSDANGPTNYELYIQKIERYGINMPFVIVRRISDSFEEKYGLIDAYFDNRHSGTYAVLLKPLENLDKYLVRNVGGNDNLFEIPVLPDLNIRYFIPKGRAAIVPITPSTIFYLQELQRQEVLNYYQVNDGDLPSEDFIQPVVW